MEAQKIYEFNFEHLSIGHYLRLCRFNQGMKKGDWGAAADLVEISKDFCDFDPLELPFSEFENFTQQFAAALAIAFRKSEDE